MKQRFRYLGVLLLGVILFFLSFQSGCSSAKQTATVPVASKEEVDQAVNAEHWVFSANQVLPQRGRSRMLTGQYQVKYNKDTLLVYLPYFGRAYSAPIGETSSPLDFRSTDFTSAKDQDNKGRWNISIKPKDAREVQVLNFTLYDNGSAQLNVQLTNRDPISFSGSVMVRK